MTHRVIGLDLGASSIKAAQVRHENDGLYVVEHQAAIKVPQGVISDGVISEDQAGVVSTLIEQLFESEKKGLTTKDVIIGLNSSSSTFMEQVLVPTMKAEHINDAIPLILQSQNSSFDAKQNEMAFAVSGVVETERGMRLRVAVFRTLSKYVEKTSKIVESAGLNVVGVDFNSIAALRIIRTFNRPDHHVDAIVDIGSDVVSVLIHHNGVPLALALDPDNAGARATDKISQAMGIDEDDPQAEYNKINDESQTGVVAQARNEYSSSLASRIRSTIENLVSADDEIDTVASVTIVGGGALMAGFSTYLNMEFPDTPLAYAQIDSSVLAPSDPSHPLIRQERTSGGDYLVAFGLGTGATL